MKTISINSTKHGSHDILVDSEDYDNLINNFKWFIAKDSIRNYYYAVGYRLGNSRKKIRLSRVVFGVSEPSLFVDHIDRNPLNNQKNNLRLATQAQNQWNRGLMITNDTGFKGVRPGKSGSYQAIIRFHRKTICGGSYKDPVDAAKRYNELARQYHGEFAYQNPI